MLKDPFFVVGFPRSGTTLMASLLTRHKDVFISAETHFFRFYMHNTEPLSDVQAEIERFCSYIRIKDLGLNPAHLMTFGEAVAADRVNLLAAALHVLAAREGRSFYGEKTPAHMLFLNVINNAYPGVKIIAIVRDGRDCVLSNMKEAWTRNDPYRLAAEWNFYNRLLNKFNKSNRGQVFTVKYEDLVDKPENVLSEALEFLGLPQDPDILQRAGNASVVPDWERAWKANALSVPDKSNMYKWKSNESTPMMNEVAWMMREGLLDHGYEYPSESPDVRVLLRKAIFLPVPYAFARITLGFIRKNRLGIRRLIGRILGRFANSAYYRKS